MNAPKVKNWFKRVSPDILISKVTITGDTTFGKNVLFVHLNVTCTDRASGKSLAGIVFIRGTSVTCLVLIRDKATGKLFNLEDRIRNCRSKQQKAINWLPESDELLAITLHVTGASKGMPILVNIDGPAKKHFEAGQKLYMARQGQMNLSCTQCHDQHYGQRLYNDKLSQGHPNGYPIFRLDWQYMASLERRLRFCYASVKAEVPPWGHQDMRNLNLYLMWRAQGLPIEVPAVRK